MKAFLETLNTNLNAHGRITPPLWFTNTITMDRYYVISTLKRSSGIGGQRTVILPAIRMLYQRIRNSPEPDEDSFLKQRDKTLIHHYEE